ncbi:MAG TPA: hypothetical protein VIT45_14140 [Allosphingosinicella sp.]
MNLFAILLGLAGAAVILKYSEGEFAGSSEEEARRVKRRRAGILLVLTSLSLQAWLEYW